MNPDAQTDSSSQPDVGGRSVFATTQWSMVLAAGRGDADTHARGALSSLCELYWYPVYAYVRRRGSSADDARDLTQEFFSRLLQRNWLGNADRAKGRFRSFLLGAVNHFLADEWDKARAQKRGGDFLFVPLEITTAETRFSREPVDPMMTPDQNFERRWALVILEQVLERLQREYAHDGRSETFRLLHPCLVGEPTEQPYAALASQLKVSEGTVKATVHRLRQRYRQLLRESIANTVDSPNEVDEELRHLFAVLAR